MKTWETAILVVGSLIFGAALVVLSGCMKVTPRADASDAAFEKLAGGLLLFKDNENGNICYLAIGSSNRSLSCVPMRR